MVQSAVLALGLGVPVVGMAVDGLARTLGGGHGVLVPPEDPGALAGALSRVLGGERPDPGPGRIHAKQFTPPGRGRRLPPVAHPPGQAPHDRDTRPGPLAPHGTGSAARQDSDSRAPSKAAEPSHGIRPCRDTGHSSAGHRAWQCPDRRPRAYPPVFPEAAVS